MRILPNMTDPNHYQAYLLRLQRGQGQSHWQATLEDAHTGKTLRFNDHGLIHHLVRALQIDSLVVFEPAKTAHACCEYNESAQD